MASELMDSTALTVALRIKAEEAKAESDAARAEASKADLRRTIALNEWATAASPFKVGDQVVYVRKTWRSQTTETWSVESVAGRIPRDWKPGDTFMVLLNCRNIKKGGALGIKRCSFEPDDVTFGAPAGGAA